LIKLEKYLFILLAGLWVILMSIESSEAAESAISQQAEIRAQDLLARMTMAEKVGQMTQVNGAGGQVPDDLREALKAGRIGSILNEVDVDTVNEMQRIAVEESRLGIPLLIGRDVIHGFQTVLPIPLGQAATWNPDLVERGARMAALEAATTGVNWTFAPMIDISRDPRWGRIAESFGFSVSPWSKGSRGMTFHNPGTSQPQPNTSPATGRVRAAAITTPQISLRTS
jgi:beta-glucosidase